MSDLKMPSDTAMRRTASGFTLLEVLIAIVVVAFGLLGLAGLQAFALKNNSSAAQRVTATHLASDMIDRMKANFTGVVAGEYNKSDLTAYAGPGVPGCNTTAGCSSTDLAVNDRFEWSQQIAQTLPGGTGMVCVDSTPTTPDCLDTGLVLYVVKIWWVDDRSQANPNGITKYVYMAFNP